MAINSFTSWRIGYIAVALVQLALAVCFALTLPMWTASEKNESKAEPILTEFKTPLFETFRRPEVWFSVLLFFIYVGAEVGLGTWAYTLLTESRGIPSTAAGFWAGSYWGTFTVGRVLAGLYAHRIGVNRLIWGSLLGALIGAALLWWNPAPAASLAGVALIGLSVAPIFPGLVSGTSQRVSPRHAANTIGMQMGATGLGAALIPGLIGVLADQTSLEVIPICLFALFALLALMYLIAVRLPKRSSGADFQPGD